MRRPLWTPLLAGLCLALATVSTARSETVTATVVVNPLEVRLWVNDAGVRVGEGTDAIATVRNSRPSEVRAVVVRLHAAPPGVRIAGALDQLIESIPPGGQRKVSWRLCLTQVGNYVMVASARSDEFAEVESEAVVLEARPGRTRPC